MVLLLFFTIMLFNICCGFGQTESDLSDIQIKTLLKNFYTIYITEFPKAGNENKLDSIRGFYCSQNLLNKINTDSLNYDRFLKAQDSDTSCLNTLEIGKDSTQSNVYIVSYIDNYEKSKIIMHLSIISQIDSFKIDSVW